MAKQKKLAVENTPYNLIGRQIFDNRQKKFVKTTRTVLKEMFYGEEYKLLSKNQILNKLQKENE